MLPQMLAELVRRLASRGVAVMDGKMSKAVRTENLLSMVSQVCMYIYIYYIRYLSKTDLFNIVSMFLASFPYYYIVSVSCCTTAVAQYLMCEPWHSWNNMPPSLYF